jgi:GTP-binding protein
MRLQAQFVASATAPSSYPRWNRREVAFVGRSNVGKSSLLNALTGIHGLARTSKLPGRTRAVNFFACGELLALVDLPGYGYAKMSRAEAEEKSRLLRDYLTRRPQLVGLVLLIDARRGPEPEELELIELVRSRKRDTVSRTLIVVATKGDKLRSAQRAQALARFRNADLEPIICSAMNGEGIDKLRRRVLALAHDEAAASTIDG